jgi:PAS domain S-box-containing protein
MTRAPPRLPMLDELYDDLKHRDSDWLLETLRSRYQSIGQSPDSAPNAPKRTKRSRSPAHQVEAIGRHDITIAELPPGKHVSDYVAWFRAFDWSQTGLGPMSAWNDKIRASVNFLLADPRAAAMFWGPQRIMLYNEGYAGLLAGKHPTAMGKRLKEVWPDADEVQNAITLADRTGAATVGNQEVFFVDRRGYVEEVYADWSLIPVLCGENCLYYNAVSETTEQVVYQRQKETLLRVEKETAEATEQVAFWKNVIRGLEGNPQDAPWAVIYSSEASRRLSSTSLQEEAIIEDIDLDSHRWLLQGSIGIPDDEVSVVPAVVDAAWSATNFSPHFKSCISSGEIQILHFSDGTLSPHLKAVAKSRAYGDECKSAVLIPLGRPHEGHINAFILLGVNSRRAYNDPYQSWIRLLHNQLVSSLVTLKGIEDDQHRIRIAAEMAALDRKRLTEKLALTEHEARDNESRFRTIADNVPVAMYEISVEGEILYANDSYFELLGIRREDARPFCWVETIHESALKTYEDNFKLLAAGESVRYEAMMKKPFVANDVLQGKRIEGETWILMTGYAVKNADGSMKSIQGALIDISRQKWMESSQERRMQELLELKRQQEKFMDMVGHEVRNPLSAITLCAESILDSLESAMEVSNGSVITIDRGIVEGHVENAQVITTCIQHQRRIIDDVLTLSKLDSGLLVIAPCEVQPSHLIEQSLRMFAGEVQESDINLKYIIDSSYHDLEIDWVLLDPSRLLQINLNLVTNAIKFTRNEPTRNITVTLAASRTRPTHSPNGTTYLEAAASASAPPSPAVSPSDEDDSVYLMIAVHDSGIGIPAPELDNIFLRFQQSSPKTHVRYGGSGLGLFISRELARLQGGRIGVASEYGRGSTFEFYIRTKRCSRPEGGKMTFGGPGKPGERRLSLKRMFSNGGEGMGRMTAQPRRRGMKDDTSNGKKYHILLVEDNLVNQKVMSKQLAKAGHYVALANHGQEAVDYIKTTTFARGENDGKRLDCILMDIEMPVSLLSWAVAPTPCHPLKFLALTDRRDTQIMDGLEATRTIRAMEASGELNSYVPVIAVTANARSEQQQTARHAGVNAVGCGIYY